MRPWTVILHCEMEIDKRIPACWGQSELSPLSEKTSLSLRSWFDRMRLFNPVVLFCSSDPSDLSLSTILCIEEQLRLDHACFLNCRSFWYDSSTVLWPRQILSPQVITGKRSDHNHNHIRAEAGILYHTILAGYSFWSCIFSCELVGHLRSSYEVQPLDHHITLHRRNWSIWVFCEFWGCS